MRNLNIFPKEQWQQQQQQQKKKKKTTNKCQTKRNTKCSAVVFAHYSSKIQIFLCENDGAPIRLLCSVLLMSAYIDFRAISRSRKSWTSARTTNVLIQRLPVRQFMYFLCRFVVAVVFEVQFFFHVPFLTIIITFFFSFCPCSFTDPHKYIDSVRSIEISAIKRLRQFWLLLHEILSIGKKPTKIRLLFFSPQQSWLRLEIVIVRYIQKERPNGCFFFFCRSFCRSIYFGCTHCTLNNSLPTYVLAMHFLILILCITYALLAS